MGWLPDSEKRLMIWLLVLTQSTNVETHTDRQTDTAWRRRPRLSIASRGKTVRLPQGDGNSIMYIRAQTVIRGLHPHYRSFVAVKPVVIMSVTSLVVSVMVSCWSYSASSERRQRLWEWCVSHQVCVWEWRVSRQVREALTTDMFACPVQLPVWHIQGWHENINDILTTYIMIVSWYFQEKISWFFDIFKLSTFIIYLLF